MANGGSLGFEAALFKAADKLRGNMEPSDYKRVALGLIFLKYISDAFEAKHKALLTDANLPTIGTLIDDAMRAIEKDNESLKGLLPKDYARPTLNKWLFHPNRPPPPRSTPFYLERVSL